MKNCWKRLVSGSLALVLAGSLALPGLAAETVETPPDAGEAGGELLEVTVGSYTPKKGQVQGDVDAIQAGKTYTLIALPASIAASGSTPKALTPEQLLAASGQALFLGSAVASADGQVTFEQVRLRTAEAAVYYVTGPGLDAPLAEATGLSTSAYGYVKAGSRDQSATISLIDAETGYRYGNSQEADAEGYFYFDSIAPGSYDMRVTKPGFLPSVRPTVKIEDDAAVRITDFDVSDRVGDVTNNGVRDVEDLAALLLSCGKDPAAAPSGFTPDLNGDGAVGQADASLLAPYLKTGTAEAVSGALIVFDTDPDPDAQRRTLTFSHTANATISAAAFSITYRSDAIQPLNENGGLVAPVDGGSLANCLVPAAGFTSRLTNWTVEGELVTLTFALTAETPQTAENLAQFHYRPVNGSTGDFYRGVFTLSHAAALAGKETVLTEAALTYPGSDSLEITSLSIDQQPGPGEEAPSLTIPLAGQTAVLPLSVTGHSGAEDFPDLPGVSWIISRTDGKSTDGITVDRGLLTVTAQAVAGEVSVTAVRDEAVSAPLSVKILNAPSVASEVRILRNGQSVEPAEFLFDFGSVDDPYVQFEAQVLDQYGQEMTGQTAAWSVSDAPAGVSIDSASGRLSADAALTPAGLYTLSIHAQSGGVQATQPLELRVEVPLKELSLSGPQSAVIPTQEAGDLTLNYVITAVDAQNRPRSIDDLALSLTVSPADQGVTATCDVTGTFLTVSPDAQAGAYTLTARAEEGERSYTAELQLELKPDPEQTASRAVLYYNKEPVSAQALTIRAGASGSAVFTAQLLNAAGETIAKQPEDWTWTLSPATAGVTLTGNGATGTLSVADTLTAGSYPLELTAREGSTGFGLSVKIPVTLTVTPVLASLALEGPAGGKLTIPIGTNLTHVLALTATDTHGQSMALPEDLVWSVRLKGTQTEPTGVSVEGGTLTITPAAKAQDITVTAASADGKVTASVDVTLEAAAQVQVLTLYRTIAVSGEMGAGDTLAPVTDNLDAKDVREGVPVVFTYYAKLINQSTGEVEDVTDQVTWVGGRKSFEVDANAESGVYTAGVTAIYAGQSASVTAKVSVYPDVTDLRLCLDSGETEPPYTLAVPSNAPKTYTAQVLALVNRDGKSQLIPLADLGLNDYALEMKTPLSGIYYTVDKASGTLAITLDPVAIQNSMAEPEEGASDTRYVRFVLDYFPGETMNSSRLALRLTRDEAKLDQAILRRGVGQGSAFTFETAKASETIQAAAGTLSNCYALELLDQYGKAVLNETVTWTLSVPDALKDAQGNYLVSLMNPGQSVSDTYPNYTSLRRLRVSADAPEGTYSLVLSASAGDFTRTQVISMTIVPAASVEEIDAKVTGSSIMVIPMYYAKYNDATPNSAQNTASFAVALRTADGGQELNPASYTVRWSVVDPTGKAPAGVTVAADRENPCAAVVSVDRTAQPAKEVRVTVSVTDQSGAQVQSFAPLELSRSASVPTLLYIRKNGRNVTSDSYSLSATQSQENRQYTCLILDQYNEDVTQSATQSRTVSWSISRHASLKVTGSNTAATVTVTNTGAAVSITAYLRAYVSVEGVGVTAQIPLSVSISSNSSGGGGGGGGVVTPPSTKPSPSPSVRPSPSPSPTPSPSPSVAPPPVATGPSNVTLSPAVTQSGSSGTAALTADQEKTLTEATASGGTVTIIPTGGNGLTSVSVTLTAATASAIAAQKNQSLRVQTTLGTVVLSPESLKALAARGGRTATVTLSNTGGVLKVDFSCGSSAGSLPGSIALSAPTTGNVAVKLNTDGTETILKKAVVANNRVLARLNGSTQLRLETRTPTFSDTQGHWAQSAITFTAARELFQGTSATRFSPDATMTRSMLVTVLHRLEDLPASGSRVTFSDVPSNTWYTQAVGWANAKGIVQGTDAGFKPEDPVTREQLATILYRYMGTLNLSTSARNNLYTFSDRGKVSPWAQEAMQWAVASGLIRGKSGNLLDPTGKATRAEVSTILERLIRSMVPTV